MISQEKIDQIEKYLSFEMGESERLAFENQLNEDADLSAEFEKRERAHRALDYLINESLRAELKAMESEQSNVIPMASRKRRTFSLAIAASVLVLVGAFFVFFPSGSNSPAQMAMQSYEAPSYAFRSGADVLPTNVARGIDAVQSGDYDQAITLLSAIGSDHDFRTIAQYYLAHAYYLKAEYSAAINAFDLVAEQGDMRYTDDAQWYALLSCMAQDNPCEERLNAILQDDQHRHHSDAVELRNQLK